MANPSVNKRQKERARQEKQAAKDADRAQRRATKPERTAVDGEDPDLAGMVAGPQPIPEEEDP